MLNNIYSEDLFSSVISYITARNSAINSASEELQEAMRKFPAFNSAHEGFAVLKKEVDELWEEVRAKQGARDITKMRKEAAQVAAMAMRFILDVCDSDRGQK